MKKREEDGILITNHSKDITFVETPYDFIIKFDEYKKKKEYNPFKISNDNDKFSMMYYKDFLLKELKVL